MAAVQCQGKFIYPSVPVSVMRALSLAALVFCGPGCHGDPQDCLADVYTGYADAQRTWQRSLRGMIVSARVEFTELAQLAADLQLAMIDKGEARFRYLVDQASDRLNLDGGLAGFVNIGLVWSDEDNLALMANNPDYRALEERISRLRADNDTRPDWPALRTYFRTEMSASEPYADALERLASSTAEWEDRLDACTV